MPLYRVVHLEPFTFPWGKGTVTAEESWDVEHMVLQGTGSLDFEPVANHQSREAAECCVEYLMSDPASKEPEV